MDAATCRARTLLRHINRALDSQRPERASQVILTAEKNLPLLTAPGRHTQTPASELISRIRAGCEESIGEYAAHLSLLVSEADPSALDLNLAAAS